ncbi:hypothetical protein [Gordonia jacobaea]|uniref:hypothetical protein n=1 Tax=Gordonia jacobaea TaxID=122202 RepID=UPI000AC6C84B|nr:hypothetical protein [Gordonia jacobaea]
MRRYGRGGSASVYVTRDYARPVVVTLVGDRYGLDIDEATQLAIDLAAAIEEVRHVSAP